MIETNRKPQDTAGYCARCNQLVARDSSAACSKAGHEPQFVRGLIDLKPDGTLPYQLPPFNWAAALFPPLWGPAHGAWAGAIMLPLFLFTDSALQAAVDLPGDAAIGQRIFMWCVTAFILAGTLFFMYRFGRSGWGVAWRRANEAQLTVEGQPASGADAGQEFEGLLKKERLWLLVSTVMFAGMMTLALYWWSIR